jgi:hypothetical protein
LRERRAYRLEQAVGIRLAGMLARNASSTRRRLGRICMQLMQQKVQKSRMTSLPRKAARVSGAGTLNQARPG